MVIRQEESRIRTSFPRARSFAALANIILCCSGSFVFSDVGQIGLNSELSKNAGRHRSRFVRIALDLSPLPVTRDERRRVFDRIEALAAHAQARALSPSVGERLQAISRVLFVEEGFKGSLDVTESASLSINEVLEKKAGTCLSLVILYLAVAKRAGLEVHAAATPVHLFVRYEGPDGVLNVETLEGGRFLDEETYRRRHRIDESSIDRGIFLRPLPDEAVLAHFLSNLGALHSAAGLHRRAMRDFKKALKLYPDLVAAWYNRGLEQLNHGDFEEARSYLSRAIELHPLDAEAFNNRGLANLRLGDRLAAERDFQEALRLEPGQKEARRNLELLRVGTGPESEH